MDRFDFGRLVAVQCETASLVARLDGMKAENQARAFRGEAPLFVQIDFDKLSTELWGLGNAAQDIARG